MIWIQCIWLLFYPIHISSWQKHAKPNNLKKVWQQFLSNFRFHTIVLGGRAENFFFMNLANVENLWMICNNLTMRVYLMHFRVISSSKLHIQLKSQYILCIEIYLPGWLLAVCTRGRYTGYGILMHINYKIWYLICKLLMTFSNAFFDWS